MNTHERSISKKRAHRPFVLDALKERQAEFIRELEVEAEKDRTMRFLDEMLEHKNSNSLSSAAL